jgi:hypothetical protein
MKPAARTKERRSLRKEYRFDYRKARTNRFASRMGSASIAIVLDPDVASVFRSSKAVNAVLRSVISAMPKRSSAGSVPKRRAV